MRGDGLGLEFGGCVKCGGAECEGAVSVGFQVGLVSAFGVLFFGAWACWGGH